MAKQELEIPEFYELIFITISRLYKSCGLRSDLSNERVMFDVSKVRSTCDKVTYSDVYETMEENMSFSNVEGRKNRNIRDNWFVVYTAINDFMDGNGASFDIQCYDVIKYFNEILYEEWWFTNWFW